MKIYALIYLAIGVVHTLLSCDTPSPGAVAGKFICGERGYLNRTDVEVNDKFTADLGTCTLIARRFFGYFDQSPTHSYSHNNVTNECTLYRENVTHNHFVRQTSSQTFFYYINCFLCKLNCSKSGEPTTDLNIIFNGGLEFSKTNPAPFTGNPEIGSPGFNSQNALACTRGGGCGTSQHLLLCPFQQYLLQFDFSINSTIEQSYVNAVVGDFAFSTSRGPASNRGIWRTAAGSFVHNNERAPHSEMFYLDLYRTLNPPAMKETVILVDNMKAIPIETPLRTNPNAPNLLENPGFETGDLAPWTIFGDSNSTKIVTPGLNSTYAIQSRPLNNTTIQTFTTISQDVTTVPGTRYIFSFSYKFGKGGYRGNVISAQFNGTYTSGGWGLGKIFPAQENEWHRFERLILIVEDKTTLGLQFYHTDQGAIGTVDNVSFSEAA